MVNPPSPSSSATTYTDPKTHRRSASEAEGLNFKSTQEGLTHAQPELNAKEMVHTRGSFEHSRIIAMMHYPTYTTKGSLINQSIADPQTTCVKWLFRFLGGLRDIVLFDFCPIRIKRLGGSGSVVEYKRQTRTIRKVNLIRLIETKMYGEEIHAYLEYDSTRKPIRLTYHHESHLL
ncbi:hypothetical protein LTR56_005652 [Elasticomyces elasticus]|nr:hypothetical protein LTR56_005652 [Elasticomyces elasticus]KAK3663961.1 hypothetical protein LTR22_005181 [Elasticomyces elasticus]KAK4927393.1 hypothetical protein LTR49_005798 [Elasticomyces elasticus]KAK5763358.1 hypothetical protein LTS12_006533 [Elasticomyces elasticus]